MTERQNLQGFAIEQDTLQESQCFSNRDEQVTNYVSPFLESDRPSVFRTNPMSTTHGVPPFLESD